MAQYLVFRKVFDFLFLSVLVFGTMFLSSCNDNPENELEPPTIEFDKPEYSVKTGNTVTLVAKVENAVNPVFSWELNNTIISNGLECLFDGYLPGEYFINFRVDANNGAVEKQLKVTVIDRVIPRIDMDSIIVAFAGIDKEITANVFFAENAVYEWVYDEKILSETNVCTINIATVGTQFLTLKVTNDDGYDFQRFTLNILPKPAPEMFFDDGHYRLTGDKRTVRLSVPLGKSLVLAPVICNFKSEDAIFQWDINGVAQNSENEFLTFTPDLKGTYRIKITATVYSQTCVTEADIECVEPEGKYFRPVTAGNKAKVANIFEYIPAPGQFINYQDGSTVENALADLQNLLDANDNSWISLGSFGGYYIVGFDHSVQNLDGKSDILINGNAFAGSSEPGIVWVMQDENGNGLPDDTWYELAGSDSKSDETKHRYALTCYKPENSNRNIQWVDNMMNTGIVAINGYHTQQSYFPMFVEGDYTLSGTCLNSNVQFDDIFYLRGFAWGYADNFGDGSKPNNEFSIEDAMQMDGSPANLKYIDFVKVHTAMNAAAGNLGEISCEVGAPIDLNFNN
jgi:hypothetical protein